MILLKRVVGCLVPAGDEMSEPGSVPAVVAVLGGVEGEQLDHDDAARHEDPSHLTDHPGDVRDVLERGPRDDVVERVVGCGDPVFERSLEAKRRGQLLGDLVLADEAEEPVLVDDLEIEPDELGRVGGIVQPEREDPVTRSEVGDPRPLEGETVAAEELDNLSGRVVVVVVEPRDVGGAVHRAETRCRVMRQLSIARQFRTPARRDRSRVVVAVDHRNRSLDRGTCEGFGAGPTVTDDHGLWELPDELLEELEHAPAVERIARFEARMSAAQRAVATVGRDDELRAGRLPVTRVVDHRRFDDISMLTSAREDECTRDLRPAALRACRDLPIPGVKGGTSDTEGR